MKRTWVMMLALVVIFGSHVIAEDSATARAALSISSKPAATPKSPAVLADTAFTAAAAGGTGALAYSWDFGDGTPLVSGATGTHFFSAAGTYNVVLTVTDASGESVTSPLPVTVTDAVKSPKLFITLNFARAGSDKIQLQGTLRLPPAAKLGSQALAVNIGGVTSTLTLNELGQATSPGGTIKLFVKRRSHAADGLNSKFYLTLKGDFQAALAASSNLTNRDADREPVKVKVSVTLLGNSYSATVNQEFNAAKSFKGITR